MVAVSARQEVGIAGMCQTSILRERRLINGIRFVQSDVKTASPNSIGFDAGRFLPKDESVHRVLAPTLPLG